MFYFSHLPRTSLLPSPSSQLTRTLLLLLPRLWDSSYRGYAQHALLILSTYEETRSVRRRGGAVLKSASKLALAGGAISDSTAATTPTLETPERNKTPRKKWEGRSADEGCLTILYSGSPGLFLSVSVCMAILFCFVFFFLFMLWIHQSCLNFLLTAPRVPSPYRSNSLFVFSFLPSL